MRKLYYVPGSPFARKVRIVLAEKGLAFDPAVLDAYPPGEVVARINPNLTVPTFVDDGVELFDSNLIVEYLLDTYPGADRSADPPLAEAMTRPDHRWADAKILTTIETMANSMVALSYLHWTGMEPVGEDRIGMDLKARQEARIQSCLDWLDARATPEGFIPGVFSVQDLALICPLLWTDARLKIPWRGRPRLEAIVARYADRPSVQATTVPPWPPRT